MADISPEAVLSEASWSRTRALTGMQAEPRLPPELSPSGLHLHASHAAAWEKHRSHTWDLLCPRCQENNGVSVVVYWYLISRWERYRTPKLSLHPDLASCIKWKDFLGGWEYLSDSTCSMQC